MKKLLALLLSALVIFTLLPGCNGEEDEYMPMYVSDSSYTASELVDKADEIFDGTVTDIYFIVTDSQGNIAPGPYHKGCGSVDVNTLQQYTVYEITPKTVYKGSEGEKKYIKIIGGIWDYRKEDQLRTLAQSGMPKADQKIYVVRRAKVLEIGESYLFLATNSSQNEYLNAINVEQFAFDIVPGTTDPEPTIDEADRYPGETFADDPTYQKIIDYFKK